MHRTCRSTQLENLQFSAGVDYATFAVHGHKKLTGLAGTPRWVQSEGCRRVSIHDLRAADVGQIEAQLPENQLVELEVRVDICPIGIPNLVAHDERCAQIHQMVARGLYPNDAPAMGNFEAKSWRGHGLPVAGFQRRIPKLHEQLIYGWRQSPAQVKVYHKVKNNDQEIPSSSRAIRIEVRLAANALDHFGLQTVSDLRDFDFRNALAPYFRMIREVVPRAKRVSKPVRKAVNTRREEVVRDDLLRPLWNNFGIQGVLGHGSPLPLQYRRDQDFNRRIGKALGRLSDEFHANSMQEIVPNASQSRLHISLCHKDSRGIDRPLL